MWKVRIAEPERLAWATCAISANSGPVVRIARFDTVLDQKTTATVPALSNFKLLGSPVATFSFQTTWSHHN